MEIAEVELELKAGRTWLFRKRNRIETRRSGRQLCVAECVPIGHNGTVSAMNGKRPGIVFRITMWALWGPLILLKAVFDVLGVAYRALLGWWLDPWLRRRADQSFCHELLNRMSYLFSLHPGKPVPNSRSEYHAPRSFDYSIASFETADLMLRFTKVRGEYTAYVAPLDRPDKFEEADTVLTRMGVHARTPESWEWIAGFLSDNWEVLKSGVAQSGIRK